MDYRGGVGPAKWYDLIGAQQFCVMTRLGLRENHRMLDFGCGSLRGGRFFIPYLRKGNYYGVEPNTDLLDEGLKNEVGISMIEMRSPVFYTFDDFMISHIGVKFNFILAQSVLSHAGKDVLNIVIKEAAKSLLPGGKFAATFFEGAIKNRSGWLGHDITTYPIQYMKEIGKRNGLSATMLNEVVPGITHPVGQRWIVYQK